MSAHPLSREEEWFFSQHSVQVCAPVYRVMDPEARGRRRANRKLVLNATNSCREGVISGLRGQVSKNFGELVKPSPTAWMRKWIPHSSADMDRVALKQPGESFIAVAQTHITGQRMGKNTKYKTPEERERLKKNGRYYSSWDYQQWRTPRVRLYGPITLTNKMVQDYLNLCDAIVGPITILLNPDRYQGNWWKTSVEESKAGNGMLRWYGVDNTCVAHPVLASLYSGLVRQCAYIARTDLVDKVLSDVEGLDLRKCLTDSDEEAALKIVKKMRRWIAVPRPKGGGPSNVPVGVGTLPKIIALHKSIYAHGFERTFGSDFLNGWGAGRPGYNYGYGVNGTGGAAYNGIHTFMGSRGDKENGKRIKELAKKAA